jgi:hypothetical protein
MSSSFFACLRADPDANRYLFQKEGFTFAILDETPSNADVFARPR